MYWRYGFSLTAHEVTFRFCTATKEQAKKWYNKLKQFGNVILLRFSRDYNLGKSTRKSGSFRMHVATRIEGGNQCAVKSVMKVTLFENPTLLVPV